ncbi:MAG: PIG-L family deacetylase [Rhizobiaceae bacterium]
MIAAHPDDEVLGCGGTIARHSQHDETVEIIFVTDGETSREGAGSNDIDRRRGSARAAAAALGAREPVFLDLPDNRLDSVPLLEIVQTLEKRALELNPRIVYTHHAGDLNIDHRIVAQATLTAFRPQPGSSVRAIYGFEVLSSTGWGNPSDQFQPARYVDISATMASKLSALECYDAEMREPPHARSLEAVEHLAGYRGMSFGMQAAEAFTVLRETIR